MAIIEYLTQQKQAFDERHFFVVNTAAVPPAVVLQPPAVGNLGAMTNGEPNFLFQPDDNLLLVSIGLFLPYQFTLATRTIQLTGEWYDALGASGPIAELTGNPLASGRIEIPYDGAEFPLNILINHPSPGNNVFYRFRTEPLVGSADLQTTVSMVNAPGALNGTTQYASVFIKALHNRALI